MFADAHFVMPAWAMLIVGVEESKTKSMLCMA